jgi:type IV pilus assembly protein PilC
MPVFDYTAKNSSGKSLNGSVDARSQEIAVALLKNQGLTVIGMSEKKISIFDQILDFRGVPQGEIVAFTRQLSTMISAGLPISRALEVLAAQSTNRNFRKIITEVLRSVEGGVSLSMSLAIYSRVFNETYISLVKAGESSGKLDIILKKLAENMEAERDLDSKFKAAMVYPIIVFIAMIAVFIILMVFVIPKLSEMYTNMNIELPFVTKAMIAVSNFMVKYIYIVMALLIGAFLGARSFTRSKDGKILISELTIKVPVFGKITLQKDFSRFSRTLSLLINSAVPIVEALNIVSTLMTSQTLKNAVLDAATQVEKGQSLSNYFRSTTKFPPLLGQMAGVGEETGRMDEVLERVAIYYEGEVDNKVKGLSAALEPIILVMLGVMVGFLIISIITPIYKLTSSI